MDLYSLVCIWLGISGPRFFSFGFGAAQSTKSTT